MRKKRKIKKHPSKVFKPPKSKYFLITFKTILTLLSLASLAAFFLWLFTGDFFKVATIDCLKEGFGCSPDENSLLEPLYGQNIFLLQTRTFSQNFIYKNPHILKAKISKKLPNSLKVVLTLRNARAKLKTGKESLWVDSSGFVFAKAEENREKLPIIILPYAVAVGETLAGTLEKKAILLVEKLEDSFIQFEEVNLIDGDSLEVSSAGKMIATFSGEKALAPQVDSLQYILHHSRISEKVIKIDLRFDKPILVK